MFCHTKSNKEIWLTIDGYKKYQVSSLGRVRSLYVKGGHGSISENPSILKLSTCRKGYSIVHLYGLEKRKTSQVHQLVAKAFLENKDLKPFVNHKDGNKKNNSIDNLEWCTPSENSKHAFDFGLTPAPPKIRKLNNDQVLEIFKQRKNLKNNIALSKIYVVSTSTISCIKRGETYGWLTKQHTNSFDL